MSTVQDLSAQVRHADEAAARAHHVRERFRRRYDRDDPQREEAIRTVLAELTEAMRPLRAALGRGGPVLSEVREASQALQRERRALRKMLPARRPLPSFVGSYSDGGLDARDVREYIRQNWRP